MKFMIFVLALFPLNSFALFQDTAVLMKIAASTSAQVVRLEQLLTNSSSQLEFIRRMKESSDLINEYYDTIDETTLTLMSIAEIRKGDIEGLEGVNDSIEDLQDKRERLNQLLSKANKANSTSTAVAEATTEYSADLKKEISMNKRQERKTFGLMARKNQDQVTAQNTALINSKLTVTNSILKKQSLAQAEMNQLVVADIVNREREKKDNEEFMKLKTEKKVLR